ncbi:hypothetical protein ABT095_07285 [Kitasatospora sp. NPDC002227]|uniref:hypothetical protein n=1 Tax=Kitasatospora sp. NPDC002227 TaxID=3154773 RepID=UPI0033208040
MFRTPPGTPLPHFPTAAEQIARFGRPIAMLPEPPSGWKLLFGTQGEGTHTYRLDITYAADRTHHLQVSSVRPQPRILTRFGSLLENFVVNAEHRPRETDHRAWHDSWRFIRDLEPTETSLLVDGVELLARRISFEGYFGLKVMLDGLQVFVCGRSAAEPLGTALVTGTEPRGHVFRPRVLGGTD